MVLRLSVPVRLMAGVLCVCPAIVAGLWPVLTQAQDPAPPPSAIRNVSPPGMATPDVSGPLIRVAPVGKLAEPRDPEAGLPKDAFEVKAAVVLDGGTLKAGRLLVHIAHVTALGPKQSCTSRLGGDWPCGARARSSLQGLVRAYTLSCRRVAAVGEREVSATCAKGSADLGLWLVSQGWAVPTEDAPDTYIAAVEAARAAKVGQWQAEWVAELAPPVLITPVEPGMVDPGVSSGGEAGEPLVVAPGSTANRDWVNPFDVKDPEAQGAPGSGVPN
ncbi:MAG: thermonuclease family protein [Pannonibacter sp.]